MSDQKHLTLEGRIIIEKGLDDRLSFKTIALSLNKDCTTISKEVRNHLNFEKTGSYGRSFNDCLHRKGCPRTGVCTVCIKKQKRPSRCCFCGRCTSRCPDYEKEVCSRPQKPPYVCNGCVDRSRCTLEKAFYRASYADKEYRTILSEARSGPDVTEEELAAMNSVISPLIRNGQSVYHILLNHSDEIPRCEKTIYSYVDSGLLDARNLDMPRKVRLRPRKGKKKEVKVDKKCRVGRTYEDFKAYRSQDPDLPVTEIDSVEGIKGGAALLTIHFVQPKLQLSFKRERNDSRSVTDIFNSLYETLGPGTYKKLFPLLLADNGSEFSNPSAIEKAPDGSIRSRLFYCDAASPGQKGHCENNHEMIRRIIPKGRDIGLYQDEQIRLMMDHINSYGRDDLNGKSPYEVFAFLYGEEALEKLGVHNIPADSIVLKPSLLKGGCTDGDN